MVEESDSLYLNYTTCFHENSLYMMWPTEFKMK